MEIATRSLSGAKLQQPRALTWLFLTELWERFSYWSLYSLLVLYLVHRLHFSDANAYIIFASFNALLYASPIIGGWNSRYSSRANPLNHSRRCLVGFRLYFICFCALNLFDLFVIGSSNL